MEIGRRGTKVGRKGKQRRKGREEVRGGGREREWTVLLKGEGKKVQTKGMK